MGKMFLMCGLSGAGKTTFAKEFAKENGYLYLGIDDFYACYAAANHMCSPWDSPHGSFDVWIKFFYAIHDAECRGDTVVIDTNAPTYVKRKQFIDWFPTFDEHNLIYIQADRDLRRRNNASRERVVPDDEMERMEQEFQSPVAFWDDSFTMMELGWNHCRAFINTDNHLTEILQ